MRQPPKTPVERIRQYCVALVEKAAVPDGAVGDNWYRYVLESGCSEITGWRRGSLQEVTQHAMRCAEELNARNNASTSPWALRRKK